MNPWRRGWNDFRMGLAFTLIGWAFSIMPSSDRQAQALALVVNSVLGGDECA